MIALTVALVVLRDEGSFFKLTSFTSGEALLLLYSTVLFDERGGGRKVTEGASEGWGNGKGSGRTIGGGGGGRGR